MVKFASGELGRDYRVEAHMVRRALDRVEHQLLPKLDCPDELMGGITDVVEEAKAAIGRIPVDVDEPVLEAASPFAAYCTLKDICSSAISELTWVDRYVDATLFYRYLRDLSADVSVCVVTWPPAERGQPDFDALLDASRLFAHERDPDHYSLIVTERIHDRWLQSDDVLYQLGGSSKDAGWKDPFTLSRICEGTETANKVAAVIEDSTELFGTSSPQHR